jgi:hypothetical protein
MTPEHRLPIDPMTHQAVPDDMLEDAGCWSWRRLLIDTRFAELFTIAHMR